LAAWPAEQLLPLGNPTTDIAYRAINLRRSNRLECRLFDLLAAIAQAHREWLFLAEGCPSPASQKRSIL
jgi:hypothetical protein